MIEEIITTLLGIILGTITGIIPGLHINLISAIIATITIQYNPQQTTLPAILILSTGITQNFTEAIQTTYLNNPTTQTSLLPTQTLLKEGKGHKAIQLYILGALFGTITTIIITPALAIIIPLAYQQIKNYTAILLATISIAIALKEKTIKKKIIAITLLLTAGIFGTIVLNSSTQQPLFLILSSLFGTSNILLNTINKTQIPEQTIQEINYKTKNAIKATTIAILALIITTTLPGMSASQATFIPNTFMRAQGNNYTTLIGSIGTADITLSIIANETIQKARNGAIATITQLTQINMQTLFAIILITAGIATITTLKLARKITKTYNKINHKKLNLTTLTFLLIMSWTFTGAQGPAIMITGTAIGILANKTSTARSNLMGCLTIPIITNNIFK